MKNLVYLFFIVILFISTQIFAQQLGRTLGARAFQCDDGSGSGFAMTWDIGGFLDQSYALHWPSDLPASGISYCAVDPFGNMQWSTSLPLASLALGNIWCGNSLNLPEPMAPGPIGSILAIDAMSMPEWTSTLPSLVTVTANQITTGTLQPGVIITTGDGAVITPGGGTIIANQLSGAGSGKFSGVVSIPESAPSMDILYSGITDASVIVVTISDPNAANFTVIANVTAITAGVGFSVTFTAPYPNPAGSLHYVVINP